MQNNRIADESNKFLSRWLTATIASVIFGSWMTWYTPRIARVLAARVVYLIPDWVTRHRIGQVISTLPDYVATTTSVGAVIVMSVGVVQWLVLRKWADWAKSWLVATLAGAVLSYLALLSFNLVAILIDPNPAVAKGLANSGLLVGVALGVTQWNTLRKWAHSAEWWLIISVGAWVGSAVLEHLIGSPLAQTISALSALMMRKVLGAGSFLGLRPFLIGQMSLWALRGSIIGVATGKGLQWFASRIR